MARFYTNRCHTPTCAAPARTEEVAEIRRRATLWRAPETLILDTETTDLDGYVVQIAVINTGGVALLNTLINPGVPI